MMFANYHFKTSDHPLPGRLGAQPRQFCNEFVIMHFRFPEEQLEW